MLVHRPLRMYPREEHLRSGWRSSPVWTGFPVQAGMDFLKMTLSGARILGFFYRLVRSPFDKASVP
ncbi:MAG: hypothetical protein GF350_02180 [Chitinivibrionales bacterium]|nr:hypothetical protein [Chitinivibrionales bacterium]